MTGTVTLKAVMDNGYPTDWTVVCGDMHIPCHALLLCGQSPFFREAIRSTKAIAHSMMMGPKTGSHSTTMTPTKAVAHSTTTTQLPDTIGSLSAEHTRYGVLLYLAHVYAPLVDLTSLELEWLARVAIHVENDIILRSIDAILKLRLRTHTAAVKVPFFF